jgi:L-asparaginase
MFTGQSVQSGEQDLPEPTATPEVLVISLGGTIAMTDAGAGGVTPALSADQLLAAVPGLGRVDVSVRTLDFRRLPGASLGFGDLTALTDLIADRLAAGIAGIVVVQGTDTIEETAYLLDLHHSGTQPIVVTGAMRNPTLAGADGPANLLAAIQTAASPTTRDLGCLVVLADEIHAARRVRKMHTSAGATFQSPNGGPLGYVTEGIPRVVNTRLYRTVLPTPADDRDPRVALHTVTLGDDGTQLASLMGRVDGVVVAAFGVGHAPQQLVSPLEELARTVPVVLASRAGAGSVFTSTYGFLGSERDLVGRGLIPAGFLDPLKARILLWALLAAGTDLTTIRAAFAVAGGYKDYHTWPWPAPAIPPTNEGAEHA